MTVRLRSGCGPEALGDRLRRGGLSESAVGPPRRNGSERGIRFMKDGHTERNERHGEECLNDRWKRRLKRGAAAVLAAACMMGAAGCGAGFPFAAEEEVSGGYTKPQAMILVATERNRYEEVYTDRLWGVVLEDGRTFETYLLDQVKEFLTNLKTMNLLAERQSIVLTSAEQSRISALAERYYEGLTEADREYIGADEKDAEALYRDYYLANKAVGALTEGIDLEVSDSEAKVISIQMIQISSKEAAEAVYRRVSQDGSDFPAIARETSEGEQTELQPGRGELPEAVENAAFALAPGEISPLIESGGWYYIVRCVSDYEEEATALRKTRICEERKNQVFRQIYEQFGTEDEPVVFSDDFWPEIRFGGDDGSTTTDFFTLYQEEFGS